MSRVRYPHILPFLLLGIVGCGDPYPTVPITEPGVHEREIEVDGRTRTYTVQVPDSWDGASPLPVLVGFHGVPRPVWPPWLRAVLGGGHTWPGSPWDFSGALGRRSDDISASARILEFVRTGRP